MDLEPATQSPQAPGDDALEETLDAAELTGASAPARQPVRSGTPSPDAPRDDRDTLEAVPNTLPIDDSGADALVGDIEARRMKNRVFGRLFNKQERLRIGRYDLLESIGHGGMGVVYTAYDDELDRKIALKLIQGEDVQSETARLRFKREAQAMAKLSHPNVVTVHEVGDADGKIYIAMEFVRGESLDRWCEGREWHEVVEVYIQAGRGLFAAHQLGIIHRDLKPHNIMRGDDGVVKVLDFGLAVASDDPELLTDPELELGRDSDRPSHSSVLRVELTRAGTLIGTPAYMAPEVFADHKADARSDQFSFCAAMYKGLYGQLPFAGATLEALVANIGRRDVRPPPPGSRVPSWLHRVILRGLDPQPELRWPSMGALVDALSRDPTRTRRRLLVGVGLAALTGVGGYALSELRATPIEDCASAADELAAVWSPARRDQVTAAFAGAGHRLADDALARVLPKLDAYARAWSGMRVEACETHRVGQQSDRMFDLRTACLDRRRAGFGTLLDAFESADGATVEGAAWATASLPPIADCSDTQVLNAAVAPPSDPEVAREVKRLREALAGLRSLTGVGDYKTAVTRATEVLRRAEQLGYEPLTAEAKLELGAAQLEARQPDRALESLSDALTAAIRSGQDAVAAEALARRMWILAEPLGQPEAGLRDAPEAEAFVEKLGRPAWLRWLQLNNHGAALRRSGDVSGAERAYRAALAAIDADAREFPIETISTGGNLASLLYSRQQLRAAALELRAVQRRTSALLGEAHPRTAMLTVLLAMCLFDQFQRVEALELLEHSLARLDPAALHRRSTLRVWIAHIHLYARAYREALALGDRVIEVAEREFPEDQLLSMGLQVRGLARVGLGEAARGLADLHESVAIERERVSPQHKLVADALWYLGTGQGLAGRRSEAVETFERANAIYAKQQGDTAVLLGRMSLRLIETLINLGTEVGEERELDAAEETAALDERDPPEVPPEDPLARAERLIAETSEFQDNAGFAEDNEYRLVLVKLRGDLATARGDLAAARVDYARACDGFAQRHDADDPTLADCRLAWARAHGPGASARARALAEQARAAYESLGSGFTREREDAEALLKREGPR